MDMNKIPSLHAMLNEHMINRWDYFEDGSPSATCTVDSCTLEAVYIRPLDYAVYINGDYAGSAMSLKGAMKQAERKYPQWAIKL
jgi:hypothetical protein